jgi:hypothetical protein
MAHTDRGGEAVEASPPRWLFCDRLGEHTAFCHRGHSNEVARLPQWVARLVACVVRDEYLHRTEIAGRHCQQGGRDRSQRRAGVSDYDMRGF